MMLGTVRKYFSDLALGQKFVQHEDGFATDNIPATRYDRSFHVEAFRFLGYPQAMSDVVISAPVTVRLYFKGQKNVNETILRATLAGEEYFTEVLGSENRLNQPMIRNVVLDDMNIEPYAASNDNLVVCRIEFTVTLFKGIC